MDNTIIHYNNTDMYNINMILPYHNYINKLSYPLQVSVQTYLLNNTKTFYCLIYSIVNEEKIKYTYSYYLI